jgi:hypothetical protein|tara:strand:- start:462 stop:1301 length:840 start_codon:yes stop_codon:yes gene_type:complete
MAKKAKAEETVEVAPQIIEKKEAIKKNIIEKPTAPIFEFKDRTYFLKSGKTPVVYSLLSKHSQRKPLLYFDKDLGYNREIKYATNQRSVFADEHKGPSTLGRIIFKDGKLIVKKENVVLQKLLSLYHPHKDILYYEFDPVGQSQNELDWIELELQALTIAKSLETEEAEAILRAEIGSKVNNLSSSEVKRDLMIFAKRNPGLFINLATDDNVQLRNVGAKATEQGILKLSPDQRTFTYGDTNRKLMTVPFDEHPYSALAAYFKTDEGMEVYKVIMQRLN